RRLSVYRRIEPFLFFFRRNAEWEFDCREHLENDPCRDERIETNSRDSDNLHDELMRIAEKRAVGTCRVDRFFRKHTGQDRTRETTDTMPCPDIERVIDLDRTTTDVDREVCNRTTQDTDRNRSDGADIAGSR